MGEAATKVIGVTGGIGAGKSALAAQLQQRGAVLVDADAASRLVLEMPQVVEALKAAFGRQIVGADGKLDRGQLGRQAFANQANLDLLNQAVRQPLEKLLRQSIRDQSELGAACVVVDAPLIFEWGVEDWFDMVIVVDAPWAIRLERVVKRSGLPAEQVRQRMEGQLSDAERKKRADYVVANHGPLKDLALEADRVWQMIEKIPPRWPK